MAIAGILAGFLSGLLGVGGGFVIVPALQKVTHLHMQSIMPTSLAAIALVSGVGVISAMAIRGMEWTIALPFAFGAVVGMLLVSAVANRFTGPRLQQGCHPCRVCVDRHDYPSSPKSAVISVLARPKTRGFVRSKRDATNHLNRYLERLRGP